MTEDVLTGVVVLVVAEFLFAVGSRGNSAALPQRQASMISSSAGAQGVVACRITRPTF